MKKYWLFFCLFLFAGCVEQIDLSENRMHTPKLVFDGLLSNAEPPYFFRLTKTVPFSATDVEGVSDALIIISDEQGVRDTLEWIDPLFFREGTDTKSYRTDSNSYYGLYSTTRIKGKEGETYHLEIQCDNQLYEATETMPYTTQIDSLWFGKKQLEGKDEYIFCPFINFRNDPAVNNFYLITYLFSSSSLTENEEELEKLVGPAMRIWPYSILKDTHLPEYVSEFNLNDGESVYGTEEGLFFHFSETDSNTVILYSITASTYDFYAELIKQMRYDGGAFTPFPASAKGNISNGALGLFRVSSVNRKKAIIQGA